MVKRHSILIICLSIILFVILSSFMIYASGNEEMVQVSVHASTMTLDSSLYTRVDDTSINSNKGEILDSDELITTSPNGKLSLYFNKDIYIFKIKNNETNYVYYSAYDKLPDDAATVYYGGFLSSSISIDYYQLQSDGTYDTNIRKAWMTKATKLSASEKAELPDGEIPYMKISLAANGHYHYQKINKGIKLDLEFASAGIRSTDKTVNLGIGFSVEVTLDDEGLHTYIPKESIYESSETYLLSGISIMPMMGSTFEGTPGYMVIPDGSGALVRYGEIPTNQASQINYIFYGVNYGAYIGGYTSSTDITQNKSVTLPIYGFVNGLYQDSVYGILEEGAELAYLTLSPCGTFNMMVNHLYPTFRTRYTYFLYGVNSTMIDTIQQNDIKLSFKYLSDEDASYVGIANSYQDYLIEKGDLKRLEEKKFKVQIDFLMSDSVKNVLGYKTTTLTTIKQAEAVMNKLTTNGINFISVLKGWNKAGFSGATPYSLQYNPSVGSKSSFKNLINKEQKLGNDIYLYNDYVKAFDRGISKNSDVAKSNLLLRLKYIDVNKELFKEFGFLNPNKSLKYLNKNLKKYQNLGTKSLALDTIGNSLFTFYDQKNYSRNEAYLIYDEMMQKLDGYNIALYGPNNYMFKYTTSYLDMQTYANNYTAHTDNVPLVPYVLNGCIDCYGTYLNFNALGELSNLRYLDYNIYPSYLLTGVISSKLTYTDSAAYYTTNIDDWMSKILEFSDTYKAAYDAFNGYKIVKRNVKEIGLVVITYQSLSDSSYKTLVINYNDVSYNYNANEIPAKSYKVLGGRYE